MILYVMAALVKMLSSYFVIAILANRDDPSNFVYFLWWISVLPYFSLLDFGYFSAWKNRVARNRVKQLPLNLFIIAIPIILASFVGFGLFWWVMRSKHVDASFVMSGFAIIFSCALVLIGLMTDGILQGKGLHNISRTLDILGSLISVVAIFYFSRQKVAIEFLLLISVIPSSFMKLAACARFFTAIKPKILELYWHKMLVARGLSFAPAQLAASAFSSVPIVMATFLSHESSRGDLLLLNKIGTSLISVASSVMPYLWIKISEHKSASSKNAYVIKLRTNAKFLALIIGICYFLGCYFYIPILFKIDHDVPVVAILAFSIYIICMININLASTEMNAASSFGSQAWAFFMSAFLAYIVFFVIKAVGLEYWASYLGVVISSIFGYLIFVFYRNSSDKNDLIA